MNNVILMGRLTVDPEIKQTNSGKSVTSFTVAVDRQGKEKQTDWINCVAWEKTAEFICKYFQKGKPIIVEGYLQTRTYEDKNGSKQKVTEVIVRSIDFVLSDKTESRPADPYKAADVVHEDYAEITDADLPF